MKTLIQVVNTYYKKISKYTPRTITNPKVSKFVQTAGNCRVYSVFNNSYLDLGIEINADEVKEYMKTFGLNPDSYIGNDDKYSGAVLCDYFSKKGINTMFYEIDVLKQTKLFADLLKVGYSFVYVRDCHDSVLADIRDNKEVNDVITSKGSRHAVNLCFINKKLTEFGSRGDDDSANNFVYGNTDIFIKSVKLGAIQPIVRFLDFK